MARGFLATMQAHTIQLRTDVKLLTWLFSLLQYLLFERSDSCEHSLPDTLINLKQSWWCKNTRCRNTGQGCVFHVKICYITKGRILLVHISVSVNHDSQQDLCVFLYPQDLPYKDVYYGFQQTSHDIFSTSYKLINGILFPALLHPLLTSGCIQEMRLN